MEYVPIEGAVTDEDIKRFESKITWLPRKKCLHWAAAKRGGYDKQYGVFRFNGRTVYAHRFALYVHLGQDPGPSVDHLCHNSLCVNVEHLRGGSIADNNANRRVIIAEECKNGHKRTPENTYVNPKTGQRKCRECGRERDRKRYKKRYENEKKLNTHSSEMKDFASSPKLSLDIANEIRDKYSLGLFSQRELSREYKVSQALIGQIVRNKVWLNI